LANRKWLEPFHHELWQRRHAGQFSQIKHGGIISFVLFFLAISLCADKKSSLPGKYQKWVEEEVVYIITPAEKEVFFKLENDKQRDMFIQEFWRQRDPTPGTPRNEFKEEHYRKIKHVNEKKMWGRPSGRAGWKTDRGRIYITLGKPAYIERFGSSEIYPIEIWYYQGNPVYGQPPHFRLLFFKRYGFGEFRLYNPIADGPRNLTPLSWKCGRCSTDDEYDKYAYNLIKDRVSLELAAASLSSFPGQGLTMDSGWTVRIPSTIMVSEVHTYPHRKVKDEYAYEFLEHKASVEVSYSVFYIGNRHRVNVLQDPSGLYFVNYSMEPEKLSIDFFEDKYFCNIKVSMRVTDKEKKTVFQKERNVPIELEKEQLKKVEARPFRLCDSFPLIPGDYTFHLLWENTVSKEFTSFDGNITVPEIQNLRMSSLILADKVNKDSPYGDSQKAYQVGNLQIYPSLGNKFSKEDTLYVYFQLYGLSQAQGKRGILEFVFYKEEEEFKKKHTDIVSFENSQDFLEEFPLDKFPSGHYEIKVSILNEMGDIVLVGKDEFLVSAKTFSEYWMISQPNPASGDPYYSFALGNQYLNIGEVIKAQQKLKKAVLLPFSW
jgi:GWxTD domain-containing protein